MNLLRTELRRLLARRLYRIVAALLLGLVVLIVGRTAVDSERATPERVAAVRAEQQAQLDQFRAECRQHAPPEQQAECDSVEGPPLDYLLNTFRFADSARGLVIGLAVALGLVGFVLGAGFLGAEWSAGTLGHLLVWEPRRLRVLAGKAGALALGIAGPGAVLMLLYIAALYGAAELRGSTDGTTSGVLSSVALTSLRGVALAVTTALAGFAVAGILRSTTGAIGLGFAYFVAGELALRGQSGDSEPWLLSTNIAAWLERSVTIYVHCPTCVNGERQILVTGGHAAAYLGALVGAAVLASAALFRRRDVT
jgi:ABC-type transport system involved in multi-copper enzyme maturation permease subunit